MEIAILAFVKGVCVAIMASAIGIEGFSGSWWAFIIAANIAVIW